MNISDETSGKKKNEKLCTDNLSVSLETSDVKKTDRIDAEDPKPRIVLTIRSEKSSAKSNNMKIVSTEEKHEEFSPRRSNRTRGGKWEWVCDSDTSISPKKYKSASENDETEPMTSKRSTSRRSKETDNVVANAIARKEKLYDYILPMRSTRRQKPKANDDANVQGEKLEEGVRTRRTAKPSASEPAAKKVKDNIETEVVEIVTDDEAENPNSVMKLKRLCELGLKAVNTEDEEDAADEEELDENDEDAPTNDDEVDDDSEVISKLLEADDTSSDEDFYCSDDARTGEQPRRSKRLCSSFTNDSDCSSRTPDDEPKAPRRRSSRRTAAHTYNDIVESSGRSKRKRIRSNSPEVAHSDDNEENSNAAGGEEGSEAACPDEESTIIATCYCETPSNVYAAPEDLIKPVFCQAVELVDGVRVGCCHMARKEEGGSHAALVRAGPRAPYFLACNLHTRQLLKHMCCPACGLFCTQGIFYQCSKGHLFHLECGLPYNESKGRAGCPHCGVYSYRWQPVNRDCCKVQLEMNCSNKRIFLPDQREQCTPAHLGFSILSPSRLDNEPVIPEDLLPSLPIDLKVLCDSQSADNIENDNFSAQSLYDAILADETIHQLLPKIVRCKDVNEVISSDSGDTCMHAAAKRGHVAAAYALKAAGALLDVTDRNMRTPLLLAVTTLLDRSDKKMKEKPEEVEKKEEVEAEKKEHVEETDVDLNNDSEQVEERENIAEKSVDGDHPRPKDEDLMKMIRYLVAAGCDVNIADNEGMTALHIAAQQDSVDVCRAVMHSNSALVDPRDLGGWTPLVWAAENNNINVLRFLLKEGGDATSTDKDGNGAVHWCALAGASACLSLLLQRDPDLLHALNAHGDTPLHIAARQGHFACVVILLAWGAKTDVENSAGEVPADVCTGQCHNAISLNMQMTIPVNESAVKQRILSHDISNGRETYPIPCVNEVDDASAPEEFTYVTRHVMPQHIAIDDTLQTMQGCSCKEGDCSDGTCACCVLSVRSWMSSGRLHHSFPYHDSPMIFECNETCSCNAKKCNNRSITRLNALGATFVRCEVFRCEGGRGWGLRAHRHVRRGEPVATYCGELVPAHGADARPKDHYMFALDINEDLLERCSEDTQLCVDAAQYGSSARFINHSCRPNLVPVRVFTSCRDLRLPHVTLFATRDIRPMDEFTYYSFLS